MSILTSHLITQSYQSFSNMANNRYYPRFMGRSSTKMAEFRLQKQFPKGNASRYPIGIRFPFQVDVSFGSMKKTRPGALRINTVQAIKNSANKVRTKQIWEAAGDIPYPGQSVMMSDFVENGTEFLIEDFEAAIEYPMVMKRTNRSGGEGFYVIRSVNDLASALAQVAPANIPNIFFEPFFDKTDEYRIHVAPLLAGKPISYRLDKPVKQNDGTWSTQMEVVTANNGVIHQVKKKVRGDAQDVEARNFDQGTTFFTSRFDKPANWTYVCSKAVEAIDALGLDFGFVDVLYNRNTSQFVFCESGSNPGMQNNPEVPTKNVTLQCYLQAMKHIILARAQATEGYQVRVPKTATRISIGGNISSQ